MQYEHIHFRAISVGYALVSFTATTKRRPHFAIHQIIADGCKNSYCDSLILVIGDYNVGVLGRELTRERMADYEIAIDEMQHL